MSTQDRFPVSAEDDTKEMRVALARQLLRERGVVDHDGYRAEVLSAGYTLLQLLEIDWLMNGVRSEHEAVSGN